MPTSRLVSVAAAALLAAPLLTARVTALPDQGTAVPSGQHHPEQHHPDPHHKGQQERAPMERHFDDAEKWAKEFDDPARDQWQMPAKVIDALGLKPGQAVADIGAGTGYFSAKLAKHPAAPTVYAVDIEPSMVAYLGQRATKEGLKNLTAVQAGDGTPNLPAPVDVVLLVDVYHHIPNRLAYFTALRKSLKPGGRLVIVDFKKDSPSGPPVEFRFTPDDVAKELAPADYTRTTVHEFLPRQWMAVFELPPKM